MGQIEPTQSQNVPARHAAADDLASMADALSRETLTTVFKEALADISPETAAKLIAQLTQASHAHHMAEMVQRFNETHGAAAVAAYWAERAASTSFKDPKNGGPAEIQELYRKDVEERCPPTGSPFHDLIGAIRYNDLAWCEKYGGPLKVTDRERAEASIQQAMALLTGSLPPHIQAALKGFTLINAAQAGERFALLFEDKARETRRLVTDTACLEVVGMTELSYVDISADGALFLRSRGGHATGGAQVRVFFDGERLMSKRRYDTCTGGPVFFSGSYTYAPPGSRDTIINGYCYGRIPLTINPWEDLPTAAVSFLDDGVLEFSEGDETRRFEPRGVFLPGERTILADGFIRVGNSEYISFKEDYQR